MFDLYDIVGPVEKRNKLNFLFIAPIDIQSILNGAAKFCRHCDVVILNSLIRKKVSDLPFLSKEEAEPGDELCFCSAACYMQFALMHRTPTNTQDKVSSHYILEEETNFHPRNAKKKKKKNEKKFTFFFIYRLRQ